MSTTPMMKCVDDMVCASIMSYASIINVYATWTASLTAPAPMDEPGVSGSLPKSRAVLQRILESAESIVRHRGRFKTRPPTEMGCRFIATAVLHGLVVLVIALYPWVVWTQRYDGFVLMFVAVIVAHWLLISGECWLSYIEKSLLYEDYNMGDAPGHHWVYDVVPPDHAKYVFMTVSGAICLSVAIIWLRNVNVQFAVSPRCVTLRMRTSIHFG